MVIVQLITLTQFPLSGSLIPQTNSVFSLGTQSSKYLNLFVVSFFNRRYSSSCSGILSSSVTNFTDYSSSVDTRLDNSDLTGSNHIKRIEEVEATGSNHRGRVEDLEATGSDHETRMNNAEVSGSNHRGRIVLLETTGSDHESRLDVIEGAFSTSVDSRLDELEGPFSTSVDSRLDELGFILNISRFKIRFTRTRFRIIRFKIWKNQVHLTQYLVVHHK